MKFIDLLTLHEVACLKALDQEGVRCTAIISGESNSTAGVYFPDGTVDIIGCFKPDFDLTAWELGAFVENNERLYAPSEPDHKYHVVWSPVTADALKDLGFGAASTAPEKPSPDEYHGAPKSDDATAEPVAAEASSVTTESTKEKQPTKATPKK